jgi:CheY-like chemotaxis protein
VTGSDVTAEEFRIRVLVVDDTAELRGLVRVTLELDGRFEVVGEAVDGIDGIEQAAKLQPDVILLDRSMPRMTGVEALPEITKVAPGAAVIVYTAESDDHVHQAAVAAGAVDVMVKDASVTDIAVRLTATLLRRWADPEAEIAVTVGPVPSDAALDWIDNTIRIVDAVEQHPEVTDTPIDPDVFGTFRAYLQTWRHIAETDEVFLWGARAAPAEVNRLIDAWGSIDRIDDDRLRGLGCDWSSAQGREFFHTLTSAVLAALDRHEETALLAARLQEQWSEG